ncbi:CBS domain-containing protein CBSX1, chloroplastic-like isoform X1 [Phragmites australis]|uniref:CBS domain-containing protein CBSX1, chloroplastic-like isoform X1 n=1 Tax=Phragmites australis TaxID=29695 RepID=UPI002D77CDC6|nr:CBS domain-containing protein CBSX1, chloroplastic-like isoform X1 [Phragmites australis]
MDATLLLLSADCAAAAGGRWRRLPASPAGSRVASPGPCARPQASVRASAAAAAPAARGLPHHASVAGQSSGIYTVGDFMTKREELHVVKPTTSVDEALEMLVDHRITGFPVIDDDWNLVGVVSDYDLLALDSISGTGLPEADIFPVVNSTWKTFREIQRLLSKTNGKVIGDVMTSAPLVVRETTNLEDAARLLLVTKYRRLPVVDSSGKLVGIITRGNVVRAALEIKKKVEGSL